MRVLAGVCIFFMSFGLSAQHVSGHAKDATGNPVVFASVVITACSDHQVLAYTHTDDHGFYRLDVRTTCDSITLTIRALGYKTVASGFAVRHLPATHDVVLEGTVLQEVMIKAKTPPVIARGDTTEYNVASFSDSTEFSVEDLLRKLPGAQVSENGRITLHGKEVERVLIEGDDLFNQNYQIATRNVRANMISKVQAIDRYQDNPLMKGIQESERLVLNLKIKEEKKRSNSGSITPGIGYGDEWKWSMHANLFSLTRRDKTILIGSANNTGDASTSGIGYLNQENPFDRSRNSLQGNPLQTRTLLRNLPLETAGLPPEFSRINRAGLLAISHIMPLSPVFKVKVTGWAGKEDLRQRSHYDSRYLLDSGEFHLKEATDKRIGTNLRNLQVETEYFSPDQKQSFRSFIQINGGPERGALQILRSTAPNNDERISQHLNGGLFQSLISMEYSRKWRSNMVVQVRMKDAHFQSDQTLLPEYRFYPFFFGLDSSFLYLQQQVQQRQHLTLLTGSLLGRYRQLNWEVEGGAYRETGRLASNVLLENQAQQQQTAGENYRNDFQMNMPSGFLRASARREWEQWFVSARMGMAYYPMQLTNKEVVLPRARLLLPEPQLTLGYVFNDKIRLSAAYSYALRLSGFTDYTPEYIFSDYQSMRRGLPVAALLPGHSARMHFNFNDRVKQFAWHVSISIKSTNNELGTQYRIDPYLFISDQYRPVRSAFYTATLGGHRYFPSLFSRLELGTSVTSAQQENKVNSDLPRQMDSRLYTFHLDYGTAFDGWVNFILKNQLVYSDARNRLEQSNNRFSTINWLSTLQITVKPSKRFYTRLYVYRSANRVGNDPFQDVYAMKGECALTLPDIRSAIRLTGVNLLNARRYEQAAADTFVQSITSVEAVRPFFWMQWDYSF